MADPASLRPSDAWQQQTAVPAWSMCVRNCLRSMSISLRPAAYLTLFASIRRSGMTSTRLVTAPAAFLTKWNSRLE